MRILYLSNCVRNWLDQVFCQNVFENATIVCVLSVANTCMTLKADSVLFAGTIVRCLTELSCSVFFIAMLLCSTDLNRKQRKVILTVKA